MRSRAVSATALGLAAGIAIGRWLSGSQAWLRLRLALASKLGSSFKLCNVRVPISLLPPESRASLAFDAEGLALCDVIIAGGVVASVSAASDEGRGVNASCLLLACFTDAHTHMVKTHAHPRSRNPTGSISDALATEVDDQPWWAACKCCRPRIFAVGGGDDDAQACDPVTDPCPKAQDVFRRMDFALASAYHHGTRAVRTHLDGTNAPDPKLRATIYTAFDECRRKWGAKGLVVQGVANLYLPLWCMKEVAEPFVAEAMKYGGVLLGAYCGNVAGTPPSETAAAMDALFGYAIAHGVMVDMHIDETNDKDCCALLSLVDALKRARAKGYVGHVLLGHCTSLSLQDEPTKAAVINGLKADPYTTVICNPHTNLGLQDRRGSAVPHCAPIDANTPRTPLWRGLTLVQELEAAGVNVGAASDNVRDWWHPYGDYDGLSNLRGAITIGQLDTAPNEGHWARLVSDSPAKAMGLIKSSNGQDDGPCALSPGAPADLVLFPSARSFSELLSRPQVDRIVLRSGCVQESALPDYSQLDDLVSVSTKLSTGASSVQRGATWKKGVGM